MLFIFDMGNVITGNVDVRPEISRRLGMPAGEIEEFFKVEFHGLMTGDVTVDRFWRCFSAHFGVEIREDYISTCFRPENDERMASLVLEIRDCGHRVVCGTNTLDSHYRLLRDRGDFRIFDAVYASHLMGCAKPGAQFYRYILSAEGAQPGETVFIDDLQENTEAASLLGIRAFVFSGHDTLLDDLAMEGIEWCLEKGTPEPTR